MKKLTQNIVLMIISILIGFFLIEAILSFFPLHELTLFKTARWNHWSSQDVDYYAHYNQLYKYDRFIGYERQEIYQEIEEINMKNISSYRVLVLGDSVTEQGQYVNFLRDKLLKKYSQDKIVIVNAGVMGYDTQLEYNYLKHKGLDLNPDLVVIQFNINDCSGTPIIFEQKDGSWIAYNSRENPNKINPVLFKYSNVYQLISTIFLKANKRHKNFNSTVKQPLNNIIDLLTENEISHLFVIFPPFGNKKWANSCYEKIVNFTSSQDINTLNLEGPYIKYPYEDVAFNIDHPNKFGDKIASDSIFESLVKIIDPQIK